MDILLLIRTINLCKLFVFIRLASQQYPRSLYLFVRPSEAFNEAENHTENEQYMDISMYKSKQVIITRGGKWRSTNTSLLYWSRYM